MKLFLFVLVLMFSVSLHSKSKDPSEIISEKLCRFAVHQFIKDGQVNATEYDRKFLCDTLHQKLDKYSKKLWLLSESNGIYLKYGMINDQLLQKQAKQVIAQLTLELTRVG
jgi:hypothetical protein